MLFLVRYIWLITKKNGWAQLRTRICIGYGCRFYIIPNSERRKRSITWSHSKCSYLSCKSTEHENSQTTVFEIHSSRNYIRDKGHKTFEVIQATFEQQFQTSQSKHEIYEVSFYWTNYHSPFQFDECPVINNFNFRTFLWPSIIKHGRFLMACIC